MKGLKETKELLAGVSVLGVVGAKVLKDGKVSLSDLKHLKDLVDGLGVLREAIKGIKEIPSELKGITTSELVELGKVSVEIVRAIQKELKQ